MWIFVGIFGGLVAVAWLADRARSHQETSVEKEVPQVETFDSLVLSDDYSKLKNEVGRLDTEYVSSLKNSPLTVKAENIKKRIQLTDRAIEISKTDEDKAWSLTQKIKLSLLLETQYALKQFKPTENFDDLLKLVKLHRTHPAEDVQIEISFADMLIPIIESFRDEGSEFDRKEVLASVEKLIAQNPDSLSLANRLTGMVYFFSNENDREHYLACLKILEDAYSDSSASGLRTIADASRQMRIMTTHRLPKLETLGKKITDRDQKLLDGILAIVENERLDALLATRLIDSCHILESRKAYALAIEGYLSVEAKLKSEQNQKTDSLVKLANDGIVRCEAVGKKFPLEFTDQNGKQYKPSDFDGRPVCIAIFNEQQQDQTQSSDMLKKLGSYWTTEGMQPILLIKNSQLESIRTFGDLVEGHMIVVGHPVNKSEIYQAFPTTHTPMYMFLDGEQNLIAVTQNTNEVITRVDSLIHKVRKAQMQSN